MYNLTNEEHHIELVIDPVADVSNSFTDEFSLSSSTGGSGADSKAYPDVEQVDDECHVEVTVDDERTATYEWEGDVNDYTGLQIHIDYEKIDFTRKVV